MRKVVITGASKGIGLATATAFAARGDSVCICSRSETNLNSAKDQILSKVPGSIILTKVCDVSNSQDIEAFADYVLNEFGGCDILINNAGIFIPGSVHEEDSQNLELMLKTNVESAYKLTKRLLPAMKDRRMGDIVNICSIASNTPYANGGSYSISKFALLGFSKNLREELKPLGIRVMSVLPGATLTDSWSGVDIEESRLMPPEDIARCIICACDLSRRTVVEEIIIRPQLGDL